jgi:hypothetical protein
MVSQGLLFAFAIERDARCIKKSDGVFEKEFASSCSRRSMSPESAPATNKPSSKGRKTRRTVMEAAKVPGEAGLLVLDGRSVEHAVRTRGRLRILPLVCYAEAGQRGRRRIGPGLRSRMARHDGFGLESED